MSKHNQPNITPENEQIHPVDNNPGEAKGRRIRGEGLEHEQDYIQERLTHAGTTAEYAEAADQLERAARDLERLNEKRANG